MKVVLLGSGLIGAAMAIDLAKDGDKDIVACDISPERLKKLEGLERIKTVQADLGKAARVKKLVASADLAINAVPGFLGFQTCQAIIESGVNLVDIAFFPEDPFALKDLAIEKGVSAVVDCGVAPGLSNFLAGYAASELSRTERILIYVGGLPKVREWPFEYRAVFSPIDVIEEYTRPARYVENGQLVVRRALSDAELISFPQAGTLEAFNTDGLRTLATTMDVPYMKEKTLRYPGHIEKIAVFRELGFFSNDEVEVKGTKIRPIDLTAKLLFDSWKFRPEDQDITVLRVIVEGQKGQDSKRYCFDMLDNYDEATKTTSMARTTGYTATVTARMLLNGLVKEKGVLAPEILGKDQDCVRFLREELRKRGVQWTETVEEIT